MELVTGESWSYTRWYLANNEPNNFISNDPNGESALELGRFLNAPRDWNDMDPHLINCSDQCITAFITEWDSNPDSSVIPEPTSIFLLGSGLLGTLIRRKIKGKHFFISDKHQSFSIS